mmetsp:Transcript_12404/g.31263  ORF Transcript_12404/g.31263 Transcript_12404/m.31263 type:complete len:311 (+) Transcript_12404:196-1128(+)|eukprot:CAMPEP_0116101980 /NCGR_PEP_ID=MMETSP0327-20121206/13101_1 /TAXON_ID=44447 /ORGANISM="Pseudo-nitzschia delicatissima, Strain B596" /LENGTH=310 /DNA_ID=CAMNT_0003593981 /DNA_START=175 /DNA_END=1107 /DNA_ORIENTATION=-
MAFDQALEADRIDGFNLFSAFVRVPLLVLGGILGGDEHSSSNDIDSAVLSNHGISREDSTENDIASIASGVKNISVNGNDSANRLIQRRNSSNAAIAENTVRRDSPETTTDQTSGMKRTKNKLSWSDESGLPLVYENDESTHQDYNVSPYKAATGSYQKPTKSAMRKSKSSRHDSNGLADQDEPTPGASRYIPNMNPRTAGKGIIMPTRPYAGRYTPGDNKMLGSSGTESPQWGWYINTTPPTPELYHSRSGSSLNSATIPKNHLTKVGPNSPTRTARNSDAKSCQNQVFQNLQNSTKANPVAGWTSIPI